MIDVDKLLVPAKCANHGSVDCARCGAHLVLDPAAKVPALLDLIQDALRDRDRSTSGPWVLDEGDPRYIRFRSQTIGSVNLSALDAVFVVNAHAREHFLAMALLTVLEELGLAPKVPT